jgi:recombinational DNA repair protein (RecF pathway)
MQCIRAAGLWTLHAADVYASRYAIRSTLEGLQRATVLCECARLLATEHQAMPALYESLTRGLDCLNVGDGVAAAREYPRLLRAAGIAPDPRVCARCARRDPDRVALDVQVTGLTCAACASGQPTLPAGVWWGAPIELGAHDVEALEWSVVAWIEHHVGRPLKSRVLMTKV